MYIHATKKKKKTSPLWTPLPKVRRQLETSKLGSTVALSTKTQTLWRIKSKFKMWILYFFKGRIWLQSLITKKKTKSKNKEGLYKKMEDTIWKLCQAMCLKILQRSSSKPSKVFKAFTSMGDKVGTSMATPFPCSRSKISSWCWESVAFCSEKTPWSRDASISPPTSS